MAALQRNLRSLRLLSLRGLAGNGERRLSASAADAFMSAWAGAQWIDDPADFPAAPATVDAVYATHLAMQQHPLADSEFFGGLGGYKVGAVGAEGQPCFYAPLFRRFIVDVPSPLSAAAINLHQIEPEVGLLMAHDMPPRSDGEPHGVADVLRATSSVVLCIECCGQRATPVR